MKTFEYFVTREFTGTDSIDDTLRVLNEYADDGLYEEVIDKFTKAANQYLLEYVMYLLDPTKESIKRFAEIINNKDLFPPDDENALG